MKLHPNNNHNRRPTTRAFTLVEMLLVLVILAVLAGIVYPSIVKRGEEARITAAHTQLDAFSTALATFETESGFFPKGPDGLQALVHQPPNAPNWHGPYLKKIPKDPWHNSYIYECPGTHDPDAYDLMSMGPDGTAGTQDDITNWAVDE